MTDTIPVIATGKVFADYLAAARANLDAMQRLAAGLNDAEFAKAAQGLLDDFDASAVDCYFLLDGDCAAAESYVPSFSMQHPDSPSFGRAW